MQVPRRTLENLYPEGIPAKLLGLYHPPESFMGVCPCCGNVDGMFAVQSSFVGNGLAVGHGGLDDWAACHPCKTRWWIGRGMLEDSLLAQEYFKELSLSDEKYEDLRREWETVADYRVVDPPHRG
jgi:hypothetical protein